ncbi:hypothetical protein C8R42DRAFT_545138, partial [Lentinula raphanica]
LEQYLEFFHGDLGTLERIEGLKKMRSIEGSAQNRLDFLLYIPGLFHMKMAAADAYARIHVAPMENRGEKLGVNEYLNYLRPKATAEFTSKNGPSFRSMHDAIHHVVWTDILQCFVREVKTQYDCDTLETFAKSKHGTWEKLVELSKQIVFKYLPNRQLHHRNHQPDRERDFVFENLAIRNRDGLLYLGFSRAISYGDVGRIIQLFPYLIATFAAVGKHKYATYMTKFLTDINRRYPPALRDAILSNWLFNQKGTADGFRPFDWLQELNNLYTKTIFAGKGPNHTRQLIFKRSVLLEVYRAMQETIEDNFFLTHRTVHHSKPTMTNTLRKLAEIVSALDSTMLKPGRLSSIPGHQDRWKVQDVIIEGFAILAQK